MSRAGFIIGLRIDPKAFIGPPQLIKQLLLLAVMLSDAKFKLVRMGGWLGFGWVGGW